MRDTPRDWVARRITADCFEVWTSANGWLFDRHGKTLNHAPVPRRDGTGLQWFGSFLPDGRWVTTDLWTRDDTLYLYSRDGKYIKELATRDIVPNDNPNRSTNGLVNWARSDGQGQGWIVSVGDTGRVVRVGEDFKPQVLGVFEPWLLCYMRQLGARYGRVPSDDGKLGLSGGTAGHGPGVGRFTYEVWAIDPKSAYFGATDNTMKWSHSFWWNGTRNSGFWPQSHKVFIDVGRRETWFFNENGECKGWMNAKRLGDAADGKSMLFRDPRNVLLTMGPELKITDARAFVDPTGAILKPMIVFDDLKLGFFLKGERLILASWGAKPS